MTNQQPTNKLNYKFGFILGVILSIFIFYVFYKDASIFASNLLRTFLFISVPLLGLLSILFTKKKLGGLISFKEAMKNFTLTIGLGLFISLLSYILIFNILDTNFYKTVQNIQIESIKAQKEKTIPKMIKQKASKEKIELMTKNFDNAIKSNQTVNLYELGTQISNFFKSVGSFLLFGLILSVIFKRTRPLR